LASSIALLKAAKYFGLSAGCFFQNSYKQPRLLQFLGNGVLGSVKTRQAPPLALIQP